MHSLPQIVLLTGLLATARLTQARPCGLLGVVWHPPPIPGSPTPRPCPCATSDLCQPIKTIAKNEVFAFMTSDANYLGYDWMRISTVVLFSSAVNDKVMCYAHSKGVRVSYGADFPVNNLTDAASRTAWVQQQVAYAQDRFMDGINLDFESGIAGGDVARREGLNRLVDELTSAFKAILDDPQMTFDTSVSPNSYRHYDYVHIASTIDFLVLMAYDESETCHAGANADSRQTIAGVKQFLALGILPHKLVVALPWYGYDYPCGTISKMNECVVSPKCSGGQVAYSQVLNNLYPTNTSGRLWDAASVSPFFNRKDSKGGLHQTWYDDKMSLGIKYTWASTAGLRGVGMWHADCLDYSDTPSGRKQRSDMWGALPIINGQRRDIYKQHFYG